MVGWLLAMFLQHIVGLPDLISFAVGIGVGAYAGYRTWKLYYNPFAIDTVKIVDGGIDIYYMTGNREQVRNITRMDAKTKVFSAGRGGTIIDYVEIYDRLSRKDVDLTAFEGWPEIRKIVSSLESAAGVSISGKEAVWKYR